MKIRDIQGALPEKKDNEHLHHSTRDEDGEIGWCDTCQKSFEGNTLEVAGWNGAIDTIGEVEVEIDEEKVKQFLRGYISHCERMSGKIGLFACDGCVQELAKAISQSSCLKVKERK